jgi:hypothetical protein
VLSTLRWLRSYATQRTLEMGEMTVQSQATVGSYAPWSMRLTGAGLLAVTLSIAILTVRPDGSVVDWTDLPFFGGLLTVDFRTSA